MSRVVHRIIQTADYIAAPDPGSERRVDGDHPILRWAPPFARPPAAAVLQRECLDLHARIEDTVRGRIRRGVAVTYHLGAGEMRDQADIGDGRPVAAAEAPGAWVARQHVLDRATA